MLAALGLDPVAYLQADPALEVVYGEVLKETKKVIEELQEDAAVKIVNALARSFRR